MRVIERVSKPKADYAILAEAPLISLVRLKKRGILPTRFSAADKAVDGLLEKRRHTQANEAALKEKLGDLV